MADWQGTRRWRQGASLRARLGGVSYLAVEAMSIDLGGWCVVDG